MAKSLKPAPTSAPGKGVVEAVRQREGWIKSDSVAFGDTSPITMIELPGNLLITGGFVYVDAQFDAAGTSPAATFSLTAPNDTGTETLWNAAGIGLHSTGFKPFTAFCITPASGGNLIGTYEAGTTTAGGLRVYLSYVELDDLL